MFNRILPLIKNELSGVKDYFNRGLIDGRKGELWKFDECGCIMATADKIRTGKNVTTMYSYLNIDKKADWSNPFEYFLYYGVSKGDMPYNNEYSKQTIEWIEEFEKKNMLTNVK